MEILIKLYLLELADNRYYVGQTDNPEFRFLEHVGNKGAKWTRLYKPIRILRTTEKIVYGFKEAMLYENWMTLK